MIDKSVRDGPWPTKIETVQFSHRAKVNRNKPVGCDRQDSRRRELEDPAVDHTGARAQVGMDARTERRRVWSGVGGLHTDRQTLFRQRVRDQQLEPVRIADLSRHRQPSATVWGFPADHLKVLPTARTRPLPLLDPVPQRLWIRVQHHSDGPPLRLDSLLLEPLPIRPGRPLTELLVVLRRC